MNIYKYEDIESDKKSYLYLIGEMRNVYRYKELHTQLLECDQWITMLNRQPIKTEYTADALLALKNIMNDAVRWLEDNASRYVVDMYINGVNMTVLSSQLFKDFKKKFENE